MTDLERLAAALADELDADAAAALAAELRARPALRAQYEAMQRADQLLREATSPPLPDGFSTRLDARLGPVLDEVIAAGVAAAHQAVDPGTAGDQTGSDPADPFSADQPGTDQPGTPQAGADQPSTPQPSTPQAGADQPGSDQAGADELARARRRRSAPPRWLPAAAAAAVVLVVGGVALTGLVGSGDDAGTALDAAGDAEMFELHADDRAEAGPSVAVDADLPEGPTVIADGEVLDDREGELLASDEFTVIASAALDREAGDAVAQAFQQQLGVALIPRDGSIGTLSGDGGGAGDAAVPEAAPRDESAEDTTDQPTEESAEDATSGGGADLGGLTATPIEPTPPLFDRAGRTLEAEVAGAVGRCLADLLAAGPSGIPAFVELGSLEGQDAIAVGLVTIDPSTGRYERTELWLLDRATCQPLRFTPGI